MGALSKPGNSQSCTPQALAIFSSVEKRTSLFRPASIAW
jgi:hypothetical protein